MAAAGAAVRRHLGHANIKFVQNKKGNVFKVLASRGHGADDGASECVGR